MLSTFWFFFFPDAFCLRVSPATVHRRTWVTCKGLGEGRNWGRGQCVTPVESSQRVPRGRRMPAEVSSCFFVGALLTEEATRGWKKPPMFSRDGSRVVLVFLALRGTGEAPKTGARNASFLDSSLEKFQVIQPTRHRWKYRHNYREFN